MVSITDQLLPAVDTDRLSGSDDSHVPDQITKLSARERVVWEHVTSALKEYGLIHRTDAMMIHVICRTFQEWVDANNELDRYKRTNDGSYITETPNGYKQPHPLYYVSRDKKRELLNWLPQAALTIPSFQKTKERMMNQGVQQNLFDDPVDEFKRYAYELQQTSH